MRNFSTITGYYDQEFRFNVLKFKTYKAKQKGMSEIAKRLTFGSLKYGRVPIPNHYHMTHPSTPSKPKWTNQSNCDKASEDKSHHYIIAYGNATFGNIRGKQAAPSKSIVRKLRSVCRMRSCKVSLVMIDEYNTSKVCPRCLRKSVVNAKQRPIWTVISNNPSMLCSTAKIASRHGTVTWWLLEILPTFLTICVKMETKGQSRSEDQNLSRSREFSREDLVGYSKCTYYILEIFRRRNCANLCKKYGKFIRSHV